MLALLPILLFGLPDSCEANLQPVVTALQQNQPENALSILQPLATACSRSAAYYELLGLASELSGKKPEAEHALRMAVKLAPNSPRLLTELGATFFQNGDAAQALIFLDQSLAIDPDNVASLRYAIGASVAEKHWRRSADLFSRLKLSQNSNLLKDEPILVVWLAQTFIETKQLAELESQLASVSGNLPPGILFSLGTLFAEHGLYKDAVEFLRQIPSDVADAAVSYNIGLAYSHLGDFEQARTAYFEAIDKQPENIEAYFRVGLDYLAAGEPRMGVPWLYRANAFSPQRADIAYALAEQLIALRYFDSARQVLSLADPQSHNPLLLAAQGDIHLAQSDPVSARRCYQQALNLQANCTSAIAGLARAAHSSGNTGEAEKILRVALAHQPKDPQLNGEAGLIELERGDWAAASQHLQCAWQQSRSSAQIGLALARVYERQKQPAEALHVLEALAPIANDSPAYHLQLARTYTALQRLPEAQVERKTVSSLQAHTEDGIHFEDPSVYVH